MRLIERGARRRRAPLIAGIVAIAIGLVVSACGTQASVGGVGSSVHNAHTKFTSLDWANITDAGELQVQIQNSISVAAKKLGVSLKLFNNNDDPSTALQNAQLMLTNRPSIAADFDGTLSANTAIGRMFTTAKLPCVGVDIQVPKCVWLQLNNPATGAAAGATVARMAKSRGWTGANTTVIGITSWATGPFVQGAVTNFYASLAKGLPGMRQKSAASFGPSTTRVGDNYIGLDAGLLPGPAFTAVQQVLASIPKTRHLVIVGLNDDVVNAALKATDAHGFSSRTMAVGLGDGSSIAELRSNKEWVAEDDIFYTGWGEVLLAMSDGLVKGVDPKGPVQIPETVVTKANVDKYYGPSGTTVKRMPLPAADSYLKPLGVLQKFGNFVGLS